MSPNSSESSELLKQMKKIQHISYQLLQIEKPELVLERILQTNVEILKADAGTIVLWESELGFFNNIYNLDSSIDLKGMILVPDQGGLDGRLYRERDREYIELTNYSKNMDAHPHLKSLGFSFAIGVPLFFQEDKLIGTMCFYYSSRKEKYIESEIMMIKEIAQQTCVAILNSRLYQNLEESKRNEEQARNFLDLLVNSSPDIILNTDLTGKIKFWNQSAENTLMYTASEMMNTKPPLMPGENEERFYDHFAEVRKGKLVLNEIFKFQMKKSVDKKKEPKIKLIKLSIVPIKNHRDSIDSVLITGKDISEKQELEEKVKKVSQEVNQKNLALTQKDRLLHQTQQELMIAEKLATIGTLSDKLNHQINNPLMGILSSLSLLIDDAKDNYDHFKIVDENPSKLNLSNESQKWGDFYDYLKDLSIEGERIKYVLKELRYFSEVAKEIHFRKNTDIVDILNQTLEEIKSTRDLKGIQFKIEKEISQGRIYGNYSQLKYILHKFIENSFKAILMQTSTQIKGEITLKISKFKLNQKSHIRLIITDNGIGMTDTQLKQVFDPFYTDWSLPKNIISSEGENPSFSEQHVGLSLATSKIILQNHHAHITVKSNPIESASSKLSGTSIIIDFPEV